jgi:hypothetical protein
MLWLFTACTDSQHPPIIIISAHSYSRAAVSIHIISTKPQHQLRIQHRNRSVSSTQKYICAGAVTLCWWCAVMLSWCILCCWYDTMMGMLLFVETITLCWCQCVILCRQHDDAALVLWFCDDVLMLLFCWLVVCRFCLLWHWSCCDAFLLVLKAVLMLWRLCTGAASGVILWCDSASLCCVEILCWLSHMFLHHVSRSLNESKRLHRAEACSTWGARRVVI